MIKFFRRIRRRLLSENKISRYLLYAIGEIILVVIGILIALSINNWNENRITNAKGRAILTSLLDDFEYNKFTLENAIEINYKMISLLETNLHYIGKNADEIDQEMKDELSFASSWKPGVNIGTLNSILNSNQLGLIKNQELKNLLTGYPFIIDANLSLIEEIKRLVNEVHKPLMDSHISLLEGTDERQKYPDLLPSVVPSGYKSLLNDVRFQNILLREIYLMNATIGHTKFLLERTSYIIELIQTELNMPIKLEKLLESGKTVDEVIEIIKQQDRDEPVYDISENYINELGYEFMQIENKINDALKLFKLNTELYPNAFNTFDSYGECLLKLGDKENAIIAYRKSVELNPENESAIKVLSELK